MARRVLVIGLDGLEPSLLGPLIDRGDCPNLARLRDRGGLARVATTAPAQTPVAWASFATGTNPGGHGIFDFLRRDPGTYSPDLALNRYEQPGPFSAPRAVNLRRGVPIWSLLADAGVPATILRCPCTYPPDPVDGRLLAGMGVPDLRGGFGTGTFYTTDPQVRAGESERVVQLEPRGEGAFAAHLVGPRTGRNRLELTSAFTLHTDPASGRAVLRFRDATPAELELTQGAWSPWLHVAFRPGFRQAIRGIMRFLLIRTGPEPALYASPINFAPEAPRFPISHPGGYSAELARAIGPYYTTGMVEDHAGLSNGRLDEAAFLDQCELAWREREAMMLHELARFDEGLFFCLFDTPDRVQHMFWRFREPDHPAHRVRPCPQGFADAIEEQYRRADAAVGAALEHADDRTLTIVLSDHGFGPFRRCVDLNAWLHERGLLALRDGRAPGPEAEDLLRGLDWSRTRAYALGLGGIYLNLRGREAEGIVDPGEAQDLKARIIAELGGLADPQAGAVAVRSVRAREELYSGPYVEEAPDLLALFAPGFRVSWGTSLGGVGASVFEDNTNAWSGDHIIDPGLVPGVLLMDRPFRAEGARLIDLAPTILQALGVPAGPAMEGGTLL